MKNVILEVADQIATITISRPEALNALNNETMYELRDCLADLEKQKDVRVIILTGAGDKAFVAGADIAEMLQESAAEGRDLSYLGIETFTKLENMPQVTIAAVNGFALGGGCELTLSCDLRIASERAVFGQPETGLGIIPGFGGTQRLSRLIGKGRAKELIFTCRKVKAEEAYQIGLVNKVVPAEELMDEAYKMARRILKNSGFAIKMAKSVINTGLDMDLNSGLRLEADAIGLTFSTHDKVEGMTAFLEKRPANLTDF